MLLSQELTANCDTTDSVVALLYSWKKKQLFWNNFYFFFPSKLFRYIRHVWMDCSVCMCVFIWGSVYEGKSLNLEITTLSRRLVWKRDTYSLRRGEWVTRVEERRYQYNETFAYNDKTTFGFATDGFKRYMDTEASRNRFVYETARRDVNE